ncbi:LrgB family protein [Zhaonella formicivorans]|jgi:predicted murein hydrolase (TIGR00659 family)|uniref:LrgB family protein n=1 Tax=Zhaonella formicivorans TaxID=2528593 RepID=UPI0010DC672C|nr:LrgB family protein [Zhaonella formicivorans]
MTDLFVELTRQPVFGVSLTLTAYQIGLLIQKKTRSAVANPMLLATSLIILFLTTAKIPYETYNAGAKIVSFFLGPATVALAVPLCKQIKILARNWQAVLIGVITGSLTGVATSLLIALLFKASPQVALSLVPKSVTTPIAMEVARTLGGIPPLTAGVVLIAGLIGALIGPEILSLFGVKNEVARGIAMGAASHALGTTRAMQESELQGAMSGVAIALVGITTALLAPYAAKLAGF